MFFYIVNVARVFHCAWNWNLGEGVWKKRGRQVHWSPYDWKDWLVSRDTVAAILGELEEVGLGCNFLLD